MTDARAATNPPAVDRMGLLAYLVAVVVVVLDQASKAWILGPFDLPDKQQVQILPFFKLSLVQNPGVSFGFLAAHGGLGRWLLVAFAAAVVVALALWARRGARLLTAVAIGLIMGGALGNNIIDRVRLGYVTDFLDFGGIGFKWVFNVADSAITVGVVLLVLEMLLGSRQGSQGGARA